MALSARPREPANSIPNSSTHQHSSPSHWMSSNSPCKVNHFNFRPTIFVRISYLRCAARILECQVQVIGRSSIFGYLFHDFTNGRKSSFIVHLLVAHCCVSIGTAESVVIRQTVNAVVSGRTGEFVARLTADGFLRSCVDQMLAESADWNKRRFADGFRRARVKTIARFSGDNAPVTLWTGQVITRTVTFARSAATAVGFVTEVTGGSAQSGITRRSSNHVI